MYNNKGDQKLDPNEMLKRFDLFCIHDQIPIITGCQVAAIITVAIDLSGPCRIAVCIKIEVKAKAKEIFAGNLCCWIIGKEGS